MQFLFEIIGWFKKITYHITFAYFLCLFSVCLFIFCCNSFRMNSQDFWEKKGYAVKCIDLEKKFGWK